MGKRERRERERVCGFFILSPWQTRSRMREERGDGKNGDSVNREGLREKEIGERERGGEQNALYITVLKRKCRQ